MISWWGAQTIWAKTAIVIWTLVILFVSVRAFAWPARRTVYPIFSGSAQLWWHGEDLYEPKRPPTVQGGYRYTPACAIIMTPLAIFPDSVGGALWRIISSAGLLAALAWFARSVLPGSISSSQFAWLTLLCLPLSVQSLANGQANTVVIACMLATVAAVKDRRWNLAALFMAIAFVFKVYPMVLGMVLIVLYPRALWWRIAGAIGLGLAAPFLFQSPTYVADQYQQWIALLLHNDRDASELANRHRDLWLLIDLYDLPLSTRMYQILQASAGAGVAALCWWRQRQAWPESALLTATLALTTCWLMLLGPVVESSTFALLAPSLAWSIVDAVNRRQWSVRLVPLGACAGCLVAAAIFGGIGNTARFHLVELHPLASLCYFVYLWTETSPAQQAVLQSTPVRLAA